MKQIAHVACRVCCVCRWCIHELVRPFILLLERFGHGGVGHVDLFVDGAGGSELLPVVR